MSDDEGAAQASAAQTRWPMPLPDTAPPRSDPDSEHTPPRGQGAPTTRAPLLPTPAVDCEDIRTERRRRDSGSEECRTLRWYRAPSPQDEGPHSLSPIRYDTDRSHRATPDSATYRPIYVRDHGSGHRTHPLIPSQNHATVPLTPDAAAMMAKAEHHRQPSWTRFVGHDYHPTVSQRECCV